MTKRTKLLSSSLALSVVLALTGCGGGDDSSSSSTASSSTGTGYYLDSAVAGVDYVCGTQSGTTDAAGAFTFQVGQDCTFKVNDIVIKSIAANALSNGVKIVEDNATVAQFLQTLDVDGDATNGIEITKEVVKALKDINVSKLPVGDMQLSEVFTQIKNEVKDYNGTVVSAADAEKHLQTTQTNVTKSLFAGKTLYIIWSDKSEHGLGKATFNEDVTESTYEGLKDDTDNDVDSVRVEGKDLIWSDGAYSEVTAVRPDYILMTEYDDKGTLKGTSSMYFSHSVAEAAYNAKYAPKPAPTPVTPSNTNSVQPIVPYTQSWSTNYGGKIMTMKMGADGQIKAVKSPSGQPTLQLAGTNSVSVSQVLVSQYITGDFGKEGHSVVTITQDYAKGTEHIVGTSTTHGSIDCVNTYKSPLPMTLTTSEPEPYDTFTDTSRISTTCPAWVNEDSEEEPTNFTMVENQTITSTTGSVSHISKFISLK
jgi:hypothetical protein